MKKVLRKVRTVLGMLLCCAAAQATPGFFTYQGRYLNAGVPSNGNTPLEFRVTNGGSVACGLASNGITIFWTSGSTNVYTSNGLFSYKIGNKQDGVTLDPAFAAVNWGGGPYYVDVCAGTLELTPPDLIGSAPYSLYASSAGYATNVGSVLFMTTNTWTAQQTFAGAAALSGEVTIATEAYFSAGRLNLGGNSLVNLASPNGTNDAANKHYVDVATAAAVAVATNTVASGAAAAEAASFHDFVASQTFTDEVTFATEAYFSAGQLNLGGRPVVNVAAPVNAGDGANKSYVDVATANAVALLSPQVVALTFGSFSGSNYTISGTAARIAVVVDLSADLAGGHALTLTLPAATSGQEITVVAVAGPAAGTDTIAFSGSTNGGFPCTITGLTSAGPGGGSASWLSLIGYGGGWACFTK